MNELQYTATKRIYVRDLKAFNKALVDGYTTIDRGGEWLFMVKISEL